MEARQQDESGRNGRGAGLGAGRRRVRWRAGAAGLAASLVLSGGTAAHLSMIRQGPESADVPEAGDDHGRRTAIGDFNGDGYGDVATSAPFETLKASTTIRDGVVIVNWGTHHGPTHVGAQLLAPSGTDADKGFGSSLAVADFNQDGFDDLLVGILNAYDGTIPFAGKVRLFSGTPAGLVLTHELDQTDAGELNEPSDWFGNTVAAGDIDANGYPDIVVGAPGEDGESGAVFWFLSGGFGPNTLGSGVIRQSTYGDTDDPIDRFGTTIAIGQFTGFPAILGGDPNPLDIAIGAPYKDTTGLFGAEDMGSVTLVSGRYGSTPDAANAVRYTPISFGLTATNGEDANFGFSLAAGHVGLSGAFHTGLVVGSVQSGPGSGRAYVLSGSTSGFVYEGELRGSDFGVAESNFDEFGWAVAVGDFDADGTGEIAVGTNAQTERVYLYETGPGGPTATGGRTFERPDFGEDDSVPSDFGWSLTFGELDETGREALLIGAPDHGVGGAVFVAAPWRQVDGHFESAVVRDCFSRAVFSRRPFDRVWVEDTGKVLAALVAAERTQLPTSDPDYFDANAIVTVPAGATSGNANAFGLVAGEQLRLVDLVALCLLVPADDAAKAMAEILGGGSQAAFQAEMSSRASSLGMTDTTAIQPSGQHAASKESTAWDMAILAGAARKNAVVEGIVGSASWSFTRQIPNGASFTPQPTTVVNTTTPALQAVVAEANGIVTGVGGRTGLYSGRELAYPWGKGVAATYGRPTAESATAVKEATDMVALAISQCSTITLVGLWEWKDEIQELFKLTDDSDKKVLAPSTPGAPQQFVKLYDLVQDGKPAEFLVELGRASDVALPGFGTASYRTVGPNAHDGILVMNTSEDETAQLRVTSNVAGALSLTLNPGESAGIPSATWTGGVFAMSIVNLTPVELALRVDESYAWPLVLDDATDAAETSFDQVDPSVAPGLLSVRVLGQDDDKGHAIGLLVTGDKSETFDPCGARADEYGLGWPGRFGVPLLLADDAPVMGETVDLLFGNSLQQDASAFWAIGFAPTQLQTGFGGSLLVKPAVVLPIALPATGLSFSWQVPTDPILCGVALHDQLIVVDPDASDGLAFSRGLKLVLGS